MAAMEQEDTENGVVFEKIGWGQWAVRKVDSDYIVTEGTEAPSADEKMSVQELRAQTGARMGWLKKQSAAQTRRESITQQRANLHAISVPPEPLANAIASDSDDYAVDDDAMDDSSSDEGSDGETGLFAFDADENPQTRFQKLPPIKFAERVPLKVSPPPLSGTRRKLMLLHFASSIGKPYGAPRHQIFNRSRLNSIENLDNYIVARSSSVSTALELPPPPGLAGAALVLSAGLPVSSWNSSYIHSASKTATPDSIAAAMAANAGRRKSSFNELHLRLTLLSLLPKAALLPVPPHQFLVPKHYENASSGSLHRGRRPSVAGNQSETDEEDWASIGAESLRKQVPKEIKPAPAPVDERTAAAFALVDLMSV